jgi:hypothetical protein
MAYTKKQMKDATDWINSKTKNKKCPVCDNEKFLIDARAMGLQVGSKHNSDDWMIPTVFTTCTHCGHLRIFSATKMEIVS